MTIIEDDIELTGDRIITKDVKGENVVKYIVFSATSVSENSELSVATDIVGVAWEIQVDIVKCINDVNGVTYAIRITCPYFYVLKSEINVRIVTVTGTIFTDNEKVYSSVSERLAIIGCKRSRIPNQEEQGD